MKRCPECQAECEPGQKRCAECGARLQAGLVARPVPTPEPEHRPVPLRMAEWALELAPGLAKPDVIFQSALMLTGAGGALLLARSCLRVAVTGRLMVIMAVPGIFLAAGAFLLYACVLCWLLRGEVCLPQEAVLEFRRKHWLAMFLLGLGPVGLVFGILRAMAG